MKISRGLVMSGMLRRSVVIVAACVSLMSAQTGNAQLTFGTATNVGPTVNSLGADFGAEISADGLSLYFQTCPSFQSDCNIRVATRATIGDPFGTPVDIGGPVNSSANEMYPTISPDGLELYFADGVYAPFDNNKRRPGGMGGADIWVARRTTTADPFGQPVNLGSTVNSSATEAYPKLSPDGLSLYFGSTRSGGMGGGDIWVSRRTTMTDPFGTPENLGLSINSSANEGSQDISADGLTFFFASDRGGGFGFYDLYYARRETDTDPFGPAVNLGSSVNSPGLDSGPAFWDAGNTLYFESIRAGFPGIGADLFQVSVVIPRLLSDLTGNGFVDFEDLTVLLANWNKDVTAAEGNLVNADTTPVNFEDLTVLLADWTGPGPAGSPEAALGAEAVPEPSGLLLALLAALGLSARARRRRAA